MILFKAGTTFSSRVTRLHEDGSPYDITDTGIRSSIVIGGVEHILEVIKTSPTLGEFRLQLPADKTALMRPGIGLWDILYTDGEIVTAAPTHNSLHIKISPRITK